MKTPPLHFDHWMGSRPGWRKIIQQGLQGDPTLMQLEYLAVSGLHPSQAAFLTCMYGYALEGQQTFMVGPKLQELLSLTDASKIPLDFIKLPFNTFYISLVDCPHSLFDATTGLHPCTGMYVHMANPERPAILLAMWGAENENSKCVGDDAVQWVTLDLQSAICQTDDDGTQFIDLDRYIRDLWSDPTRDDSDPGLVRTDKSFTHNADAALELARLAFNLILYVNSEKPEKRPVPQKHPGRKTALRQKLKQAQRNPKKRKKAARIQQEIDSISEARVVWLGESFEYEKDEETAEASSHPEGSSRTVRRHRRRGHYHPYWVGPRKLADGSRQKGTHQVLRWVPPRWVGSDIGNVLAQRGTTFKFRVEKDDHDRPDGRV